MCFVKDAALDMTVRSKRWADKWINEVLKELVKEKAQYRQAAKKKKLLKVSSSNL